jgi:hypothetical protein
MADRSPVHHQLSINKPVLVAFYAVANLYKGQEGGSD